MGLFSSNHNKNDGYQDQYANTNTGGQGYFNQDQNRNAIYDQNTNTTGGHGITGHERNAGNIGNTGFTGPNASANYDGRPSFSSYDQNGRFDNNDYSNNTGRHGIMNHDRNNNLGNQNDGTNTTTGGGGLFSRNNRNNNINNQNVSNTNGHHGVGHHDRNAAGAYPETNASHTGHNGTSAYQKTGVGNNNSGRQSWFSRHRNRNAGTSGGGIGGMKSSRKSRSRSNNRQTFDINSGHYNRRPSFGQWLKFTWLDILTMIILGAVGLGVYRARPAPTRSFPVYFQDGEIVYPQFAYPLRHEIIPIWLAALLASIIPIFIILCMQIRIRSFWDVNNAIIGLLYSLITAAVFQVFLKWLIGGLRPHFLTVCQPIVENNGVEVGKGGLNMIMYDRSICSGDPDTIDDSLESFPSGHSTAAFAGFVFLYLYLNAKLKVFSNLHPAMWKLVAIYAPILGATLIAGTLTIDEYHNWYDCLAGAIIGTVMAFSAYRMVYASVWDFRFNHIPLTRHTPFSYGAGESGAGGFETAIFTHTAGWGYDEAYGGAPFDAAHGLRGMRQGFNQGIHNESGTGTGTGGGIISHHEKGHHGTHGGVTTGQDSYSHNEKTGALGGHSHTRSNPQNINTNNDTGVVDGNRNPMLEPTTPTRGGRIERRPVGGVRQTDQMV